MRHRYYAGRGPKTRSRAYRVPPLALTRCRARARRLAADTRGALRAPVIHQKSISENGKKSESGACVYRKLCPY